jgi:hypothetical protein
VQRTSADVSDVRHDFRFGSVHSHDWPMACLSKAQKTPVYAAVMSHRDSFWKLEHLSNTELLESLGKVVRTQRRTLAELVAHLGEVEERRLHLEAAHSSMFSYSVVSLCTFQRSVGNRKSQLLRILRRTLADSLKPLF